MTCFTISELREFLLRHHVVTEDRIDKKDLIELMMQRRRPSASSRHVIGEEEAQRVSPLRVCVVVVMRYQTSCCD